MTDARMQQRRATSAQWASSNPILLDGELGYDRTVRAYKIGDGLTRWLSLPFADKQLNPTRLPVRSVYTYSDGDTRVVTLDPDAHTLVLQLWGGGGGGGGGGSVAAGRPYAAGGSGGYGGHYNEMAFDLTALRAQQINAVRLFLGAPGTGGNGGQGGSSGQAGTNGGITGAYPVDSSGNTYGGDALLVSFGGLGGPAGTDAGQITPAPDTDLWGINFPGGRGGFPLVVDKTVTNQGGGPVTSYSIARAARDGYIGRHRAGSGGGAGGSVFNGQGYSGSNGGPVPGRYPAGAAMGRPGADGSLVFADGNYNISSAGGGGFGGLTGETGANGGKALRVSGGGGGGASGDTSGAAGKGGAGGDGMVVLTQHYAPTVAQT